MSNTYVKKYDVGQIKLDLPYANYIHELPLLSFGDILHTINLSLVFNYANRGENTFSVFKGYKFNWQKRIILDSSTQRPTSFVDEYGKTTNLYNNDGVYTFGDDSQRIIRITARPSLPPIPGSDIEMEDGIETFDYTVEYPDGSKEVYNQNGYLMSMCDKYSDNAFLTFLHLSNGRLSSIIYNNNKKIIFTYSDDSEITITYKVGSESICTTTINASDNDSSVLVDHYSGVEYELQLSNMNFTVTGSAIENEETVTYIKELIEETNSTLSIIDKIGNEIVSKISYTYPGYASNFVDGGSNLVVITDKNGVKTMVQYDINKPKYSFEYQDNFDSMFSCNRYLGNISIYQDQKVVAKQTYNDCDCLLYGLNGKWTRSLTNYGNSRGYFLVSGWVNYFAQQFELTLEGKTDPRKIIYCTPEQWTYFAFIYKSESNDISISFGANTGTYETRDFKIEYLPDYQEGDWEYAHLYKSEDILNYNGVYIPIDDRCIRYTKNGQNNWLEGATVDDIIKYKINAKKNVNNGEAYYNNLKEVITGVTGLAVMYNDQAIDISAVKVGKRITDKENKQYINILDIDENNPTSSIISNSFVNGVLVSASQFNSKLDVISETSNDITTSYTYNQDGLLTFEGIQGLSTKTVTYSTNTNGDMEIQVTDEFNNSTVCTMDSKWGAIKTIRLPDNTVITNTYDGDMSALMNQSFAAGDNARKNIFGYANGRVNSLSDGTLTYTFGYSDKGELESVLKNGTGVEHHTYSENENDDTDTVVSKYPTEASPLHTTTHIYDKYGRLKKIEGVLENVYDIAPVIDASKVEEIPSSDNRCAVLSTSADLLLGETTTNIYSTKGELTEKIVVDTADASDTISRETFTYDSIGRVKTEHYYPTSDKFRCLSKTIEYEKGENDPTADGTISEFTYATDTILGIVPPTFMMHKTTNEYEDDFHRLTKKTHNIDNAIFDKCFTYDKSRIEEVEEHIFDQQIGISNYEYDNMGRISSITANGAVTTYTYDEYGQLIREDNQGLDKTVEYVYNGIGNIESVKTYDYTPKGTEPSGTPVTKSFTYNTSRPDRLTRCNGAIVAYNSMGCPTTFNGMSATWTRGKLAQLSKGTFKTGMETFAYNYNALGQRESKSYTFTPPTTGLTQILEGQVTQYSKKYYYDNAGRLLAVSSSEVVHGVGNTSNTIKFIYDESGMIGFEYSNGTNENVYYYQRNLLGDVIAIYNTSGAKVVEYAYDAWGNCTIKSTTTNYPLANANPIRYRGYYYDEDTNLYYLNARYYNPEWRRFISPDDTNYLDLESVNGLNLYCYCGNDPVNYCDPSGHFIILAFTAIGVLAGLGYAAYTDYKDDESINGSIGWQGYLENAIGGGLIGLGIGLGVSYLGTAISYIGGAISSFGASSAVAVAGGGTASVASSGILEAMLAAGMLALFAKDSKKTKKETSSEHPSWTNERMIDPKKSAQQNATEILNSKYGQGAWGIGPKSEFNQIVKWIQRHLRYYRRW